MDFKFDLEQTHTNDDDDDELLAELYGLVEEDVQKNRDVDKHHPKKYNTAKPNQGQAKGKDHLIEDEYDLGDVEHDDNFLDELHQICSTDMVASRSERQSTVCIEQNKLMHESVEHEEENEELIDFEKNDKEETSKPAGKLGVSSTVEVPKNDVPKIHVPDSSSPSISISTKARTLIERRRQRYLDNAKAAKDCDDKVAAIEFLEVVKLFNEGLKAIESGAELTDDDIQDIPGTPPPYVAVETATTLLDELKARMNKFNTMAQSFQQSNDQARARRNIRLKNQYEEAIRMYQRKETVDLATLPVPPGFTELKNLAKFASELSASNPPIASTSTKNVPGPSTVTTSPQNVQRPQSINMSIASDQLKLVVSRQDQLKKAALNAKQKGDLNKAKEFLTQAKSLDQMIIAAKGGFPVDVKSLPMTPGQQDTTPLISVSQHTHLDDFAVPISKELRKQIELCQKMLMSFQQRGDAKSVLLYEALLSRTQDDYKRLQDAIVGNSGTPKYQIKEINLPIVESNPEVPDDGLELKISLSNVKLPEGWKPTDCAISVAYDFPYPREGHQTGSTSINKGTTSPEFPKIQLKMNRTLQFMRICKRAPVKFEIHHKGGFLFFRSDKLLGRVEVPLAKLEDSAEISETLDILDGRKKTPGKMHISIKISKPLGQGKGTGTATRKWVQLV